MLDTPHHDPRALRDAFGLFATGVTVITLRDAEGRPSGVTVNSFSSLSLEPALCLFSLGVRQPSCALLTPGTPFTVNILAEGQDDIAWQFARPAEDKFAGIQIAPGQHGVPGIAGALARFECTVADRHRGGDHDIFIGQINAFEAAPANAPGPMIFYRGKMARLPA